MFIIRQNKKQIKNPITHNKTFKDEDTLKKNIYIYICINCKKNNTNNNLKTFCIKNAMLKKKTHTQVESKSTDADSTVPVTS